MKERPILMSGPMVKAILEGRKWQTRRIVKPQPTETPITNGSASGMYLAWPNSDAHLEWQDVLADTDYYVQAGFCPYGQPGDRLWVREAWRTIDSTADHNMLTIAYEADQGRGSEYRYLRVSDDAYERYSGARFDSHLRPSIFMPRWACRFVLELTAVRVERLQDISEADAQAEGCTTAAEDDQDGAPDAKQYRTYRAGYRDLWDSLNAKRGYGWDSNPWVWVLTFEQVKP